MNNLSIANFLQSLRDDSEKHPGALLVIVDPQVAYCVVRAVIRLGTATATARKFTINPDIERFVCPSLEI